MKRDEPESRFLSCMLKQPEIFDKTSLQPKHFSNPALRRFFVNFGKHDDLSTEDARVKDLLLNIDISPHNWSHHERRVLEGYLTDAAPGFMSMIPDVETYLKVVKGERQGKLVQELADLFKTQTAIMGINDIYRELGITDIRKFSKPLMLAIKQLEEEGMIEQVGKKREYRTIMALATEIDYKSVDPLERFEFMLPFDLHTRFDLFPKNIILVAGSSNSGKTAFVLNCIYLNEINHDIHYFSSEMGEHELRHRLGMTPVPIEEWRFRAYERSRNFADVIKPNAVNIIDYLEVTQDFFTVGSEIRAIYDSLKGGIAIVCLQMKEGADLGRGGDFSMEKARLYLTIDRGTIVLKKVKNWYREGEDRTDPNGMKIKYWLEKGWNFHRR